MIIMGSMDQVVQSCLKGIFIAEDIIVNIALELRQPGHEVNSRLLVALWWIGQIGESTMELNHVVDILNKLTGNICAERKARQAFVGLARVEYRNF